MLSRLDPDRRGSVVPEEWTNQVKLILEDTYKRQCNENQREFSVYGELFTDEIVICTCYAPVDPHSPVMPITLVISSPLDKKSEPEKILNQLVDCMGIFFDGVFADSNWDNYEAEWKKGEHKNLEFHYRASRENIKLTLEADKLLSQS